MVGGGDKGLPWSVAGGGAEGVPVALFFALSGYHANQHSQEMFLASVSPSSEGRMLQEAQQEGLGGGGGLSQGIATVR